MDYAPLSDLTVYRNGPLYLIYQLLDDGHAKPNAVIVSSCALMFLGERLKNVLFKVLPDTDSGILDYKTIACGSVLEGGFLCLYKYGAMGPVIFESVVNDIHQYLL